MSEPPADEPGERASGGRYHFAYSVDSVYANVVGLVAAHRRPEGSVVFDIGCGFGAIAEPLADLGLSYVGFDREAGGLADLQRRGFDGQQVDLSRPAELVAAMDRALAGRELAAITLLDVLEHLLDGPALLSELRRFATSSGSPPLVVSVPNVSHLDLCGKLLMGRWDVTPTGLLDATHVSLYDPYRLAATFSGAGWSEVAEMDFEMLASDQHFPAEAAPIRIGAPLYDLLAAVRRRAGPGAVVNQFVRAYEPAPAEPGGSLAGDVPAGGRTGGDEPLLSVIVTTAGGDPGLLGDLLVTLDAQTCEDFEVLMVVDGDEQRLAEVSAAVAEHAFGLATRTRVIAVGDLGRNAGLNAAFGLVRGRYVVVVPEDVALFGHWAEEFETLARTGEGSVLRAVAAHQPVRRLVGPPGGLTATAAPEICSPTHFSFFGHLGGAHSPSCSYALPRSCVRDLGLRLEEDLGPLAEWQLLIVAAALCGVSERGSEVTALTRGAEPAGPAGELAPALRRLDEVPLLLPRGSASTIAGVMAALSSLEAARAELEAQAARLGTELEAAAPRAPAPPADDGAAVCASAEETRGTAEAEVIALRAELASLRSSTSWRITAPLRRASDLGRARLRRP